MKTEAMIRAVQQTLGIEVDGKAGPQTWGAIYRHIVRPQASATVAFTGPRDQANARSERMIATLLPHVRPYARALYFKARDNGIAINIISGTRTHAEQDALYAQGRTAPGDVVTNARGGYSNHNFGLAFDVVEIRADGSANWNTDWDALGGVAADVGLAWGGNWTTFVDRPHFELDAGLSTAQLRERVASGDTTDGFANLR